MLLRNAVLTAGLMASGVPLAWAQQGSPMLEMDADGEIQIAPDGHVSDYRLQSKLATELASLVDRNVRGWHFEPVVVDGAPVVAKTAMHIRLKAEPAGSKDTYSVRILAIDFGVPKRSGQVKAPQYPYEAAQARLGAKVLLSVRLDDTGNVVDVQPYQTSLDARVRSETEAERWRKAFEKASVAAAKSWHYDLSEAVNGKTIGTSAMVPVIFSIVGSGKPGQWKAYLPGPVHPAPWTNTSMLADNRDFSTLEDGQAQSLESRFRLKENVIGKAL
jgi:hypothetical protein